MVNAQEWLNKEYPLEKRIEITDLNINGKVLEGELKLTGFFKLKKEASKNIRMASRAELKVQREREALEHERNQREWEEAERKCQESRKAKKRARATKTL